jgi:hypothetical protein
VRFPFQVDFPSARIFTFGGYSQSPEQVKNPPASPAPGPRSGGRKGGEERRKTSKSGKSGPLYAKEGETHNNTGFCRILYFFSRIRTHVLEMVKNLYISPPKPGSAPKAWEKKCNKLVTLQNRSAADKPPRQRPDRFGFAKGDGSDVPGRFPAARHSKKAGAGGQSLPPLSYARRHDSDGNPHGDPLADFAGPPAEDCHGAGPTLFPALRPPSVTTQPAPVAGLPAS